MSGVGDRGYEPQNATGERRWLGAGHAMSDDGDRGYEPQNLVRHFAASFAETHGRFDKKAFVMIVVSSSSSSASSSLLEQFQPALTVSAYGSMVAA